MSAHSKRLMNRISNLENCTNAMPDLLRAYYFRSADALIADCVGKSDSDRCEHDHGRRKSADIPYFSGASFDVPTEEPDRFVPEDLLRLALLSVPAQGNLVRDMRAGYFDKDLPGKSDTSLNDLLGRVPQATTLESITEDNHGALSEDGIAQELWTALRAQSRARSWGLGPTRLSKLLAAKRPLLIPVYDSVVKDAFALKSDGRHWKQMVQLFQSNPDLAQTLDEAWAQVLETSIKTTTHTAKNSEPVAPEVSVIRILDVILWMSGTSKRAMDERGHLYRVPTA